MNQLHALSPQLQSRILSASLQAHEAQCALRRRLGQREVLVLGDSHVLAFLRMDVPFGYPGKFFRVVAVEGATVSGLPNPNSSTQAAQRFAEALADTNAQHVIVNIGEVDTGFVIWYRAQRDGVAVDAMLDQALQRYQALLSDIIGRGKPLSVISAPLPTIPDAPPQGAVAHRRSAVNTPQRLRIELTLRFNRAMEDWCRARGQRYFNLDTESLGADGLVRSDLLNPDPSDHHYARDPYRRLLAIALSRPL